MIDSDKNISLQEKYAINSICFGCGPANSKGLKIRSFTEGALLTAKWMPEDHHQAFPGIINGGIIGSILDCHCNWAAAWHIGNKRALEQPPCTVTAQYKIELKRPTPTGQSLTIQAHISSSSEDRAEVEGKILIGETLYAICTGLFVAVKPGHPAFHQWN